MRCSANARASRLGIIPKHDQDYDVRCERPMGHGGLHAIRTPDSEGEAVGSRAMSALRELHAMVWGECPGLLDEDSGGNAELDLEIRDIITHPAPDREPEREALASWLEGRAGAADADPEGHTIILTAEQARLCARALRRVS